MNILENEIEDLVWHGLTTDMSLLSSRNFPCNNYATYFRQVELGNYGRADIISINPCREPFEQQRIIRVGIYELKKEKIGLPTLLQAVRYAKGFTEKMAHEGKEYYFDFQYYLIGKSVETESDFVYMADVMPEVYLYTYQIDLLKGVTFKRHDEYSLTNKGFKPNSQDASFMLKSSVKNKVNAIRKAREDMPF